MVDDHERGESVRTGSSESSRAQVRTPRFAEATSVNSPLDSQPRESPFADPQRSTAAAQASNLGFGYLKPDNNGGESSAADCRDDPVAATPRSPLKSAMKVPGTPGKKAEASILSPTFMEEQVLERREKHTEKEQFRDLKIKTRVRMAKFALRGVNFSCSLIILSMISASFAIFNATKALPAQSGLPPWAANTNAWPQKVVLAASCLSLAICFLVFIMYCRGGHRRAEKVSVYYTLFAVGWSIVSIIIWAIAAGILQFTRNNSNNKDMWGWSCVQNRRAEEFSQKVDYALVCQLQSWSLICIIIEIVVEAISITLYSVVFYRYYTKRRLAKSMDLRDKARSDLYLAQLRSQSAPNTPGFASVASPGLKSPGAYSNFALSPRMPPSAYHSLSATVDDQADASATHQGGPAFTPGRSAFTQVLHPINTSVARSPTGEKPFMLQAPPSKAPSATPTSPSKLNQGSWRVDTDQTVGDHVGAAPGEQTYEAVPIPGAYGDQAPRR